MAMAFYPLVWMNFPLKPSFIDDFSQDFPRFSHDFPLHLHLQRISHSDPNRRLLRFGEAQKGPGTFHEEQISVPGRDRNPISVVSVGKRTETTHSEAAFEDHEAQ